MTELYIFNQDDKLLTILSESTGLTSAPLRDELNQVSEESLSFTVEADTPKAKHVKEENRVVFRDKDGDFREFVIKELDDTDGKDGPETKATCAPAFLDELSEHYVLDRRFTEKEAQIALDAALEGTRYTGAVEVSLGLASTNFYKMRSVDAIWETRNVWGGDIKDVVELKNGRISTRKILIKQRLGADNGLRFEIDHNIEQIQRTVLSYPKTAMYGWGASLPTENDGYTRYIDFADVEWKKSNGDPVDKPLGQKWVGDPDALAKFGRPYNGELLHRKGEFNDHDIDDPEELLWATWNHLQQAQEPEINYRLSVDLLNKKASLGDTARAIDRRFSRPIEIQTRVIAIEYDLLDIEGTTIVEMGQFLSAHNDDVQRDIDDLKESVNKPRPTKPIDNSSFPDIKPDTPVNVTANGSFQAIQLFWDYDSAVYVSHYEVYGSQVKDFVPDSQHLLYRGRVSAFNHEVETDQVWYYRIRAVNTHGTPSEYTAEVSASAVRIITDDILFGSVTADLLADNLDLANKLSDGTLDWINEEPLYQIQQSENRILSDVGNRIGEVLNDIELIDNDIGELHYQDLQINNRIDGLSAVVQNTVGTVDELTGQVDHHRTKISAIEQRADGFEQSVIDVRGDLENARTEMSLIDQKANKISLSVSELETDFNDLEIGGRNLVLDSDKTASSTEYRITGYDLSIDWQVGETWTVVIKGDLNGNQRFGIWANGSQTNQGYLTSLGDRLHKLTFTVREPTNSGANSGVKKLNVYNYPSSGVEYAEIEWIKLVRGNKTPLDWTPEPEDKADTSNILSFINLSKEGVRIHGDKVHISGQTLIDEGIIGTAAIANAAITKAKMGTAVVGTAQIENAAITDAKIHSLNADKLTAGAIRGIDVYGSKFRSSNGNNWMEIVGGDIHLEQSNGRYMDLSPTGLYGYNAGGSVRFRADSLLVTSAALGTSNYNVYLAAGSGKEARIVDVKDVPSDGEISSYTYLPLRAEGFYGNFLENNAGAYGNNLYLRPRSGGEVRITGAGTTDILYPLRAGRLHSNALISTTSSTIIGVDSTLHVANKGFADGNGDPIYRRLMAGTIYGSAFITQTSNAYIGAEGELRVVNKGLSGIYRDVRANFFKGTAVDLNNDTGAVHLYVRPSGSGKLKVTTRGTTTTFRPVEAGGFENRSQASIKQDITLWKESALDLINRSEIYQYRLIEDVKNGVDKLKYSLIIGDGYATPNEFLSASGEAVDVYVQANINTKAIQELSKLHRSNADDIEWLKIENQYLKQKIKILEGKVA